MSDRAASLVGFTAGAVLFLVVTLTAVAFTPHTDARGVLVTRRPQPVPTSAGAPVHPPVDKIRLLEEAS